MGRRVAAIDCGTNSIRLLVADVDLGRGTLTDVDRRMEIVRLGQGVDTTGRLAPEALDRTLAALGRYAAVITRLGAADVRMVATSATRDASNAAEFIRRVTEVLGAGPEVLSGDEEARLSFTGATGNWWRPISASALSRRGHRRRLDRVRPGRRLAGPGGPAGPAGVAGVAGVTAATSVDIGCVRMTERHLRSDPPSAGQIAAATADIDAAIAARRYGRRYRRAYPRRPGRIGHHGRGIALDLPGYDGHGCTTRASRPRRCTRSPRGCFPYPRGTGPDQCHASGPGGRHRGRSAHPGPRTDTVRRHHVLVSEHDILDGIAWAIAAPQRVRAGERRGRRPGRRWRPGRAPPPAAGTRACQPDRSARDRLAR